MTNFCCAFVSFSANKKHSTVTLVTSVKDALLLPTEQKGMVDYLHYIVIINMMKYEITIIVNVSVLLHS